MNELASLNMNNAAPRYSLGSEIRPIIFSFSHSSFNCGSSSKFFATICHIVVSGNHSGATLGCLDQLTGVMMFPGHSVFTRIGLPSTILPHSIAKLRPS